MHVHHNFWLALHLCSPSGTWANPAKTRLVANALACSLCPTGTYRIGDASPENNVCKKIPAGKLLLSSAQGTLGSMAGPLKFALCKCCLHTLLPLGPASGYKAAATLDTTAGAPIGAYAIGVCSAGSVSYWSAAGIRTPTDASICQDCADFGANTVAARSGAPTTCHASASTLHISTRGPPESLLTYIMALHLSLQAWLHAAPARAASTRTQPTPSVSSALLPPTAASTLSSECAC